MSMRMICLLIGFAFGSVPTGYLIARMQGKDLRKMGSGNIGSTNVLRSLGKFSAAMTLCGDILKALIPLWITAGVFGNSAGPDLKYIVTMYTGLGAVLGHDFSPWLHFNGGKGIATSGGTILYTDPRFFLASFATVILTAVVTGFVSLGSLMAAVVYLAAHIFILATGRYFGWPGFPAQTFGAAQRTEVLVMALVMAGLAAWRHKANIQRLLRGEENKFSFRRKQKRE